MSELQMKPDKESFRVLSMTRAQAKMLEFHTPEKDWIHPDRDLSELLVLTIGILGDIAALVNREGPDSADYLKDQVTLFAAKYFDAYSKSGLRNSDDNYLKLLASATFYLCQMPGNSISIANKLDFSECIADEGFGHVLLWIIKSDYKIIELRDNKYSNLLTEFMACVSHYFAYGINGQQVISMASKIRSLAYECGSDSIFLLAEVIVAVTRIKLSISSWNRLPLYSELPIESWSPALQKASAIKELWPSQIILGENGLYLGKSAIIQMPPSAGKTKAVELIIRSAFLADRSNLTIVIAPFRALCHEIHDDLIKAFYSENVIIDVLSDVQQNDYIIQEDQAKTIIVLTPEKFLFVIRHSPEILPLIGQVIFDESHQFDNGERGVVYELLLSSILIHIPSNVQKILISAVISNADEIGSWIGEKTVIIDSTGLLPTIKSIGFMSINPEGTVVHYMSDNDIDKEEYYVPRVIKPVTLDKIGAETKERSFPDLSQQSPASDISLYLGLKLVKEGPAAIFCGTKPSANKIAKRVVELVVRGATHLAKNCISDNTSHDEVGKLFRLISFNIGEDSFVSQAAAVGIFLHHGSIPHGIRAATELALRNGLARLVVCTSTLAQGVNLPIRYLILSSIYRYKWNTISVRDFHNLIGRVGRSGKHTEGSILLADPYLYAAKKLRGRKWFDVKNLFDTSNSERCVSLLISFFDPIKSIDRSNAYNIDCLEFLKAFYKDRSITSRIAEEIEESFRDQGFKKEDVLEQLNWKIFVVGSIESFMLSHETEDDSIISAKEVSILATHTLAYHQSSEVDKSRILHLFSIIYQNTLEAIIDKNHRIVYSKTMNGVYNATEIEHWLRANIEDIYSVGNIGALLDLLFPMLVSQSSKSCSKYISDNGLILHLVRLWIEGSAYSIILGQAEKNRLSIKHGTSIRKPNIFDIVDICDTVFSYRWSMIIGDVIELLNLLSHEGIPLIQGRLSRLQKSLKYGLSNGAAITLYELGFADRIVASDIAQYLKIEVDDRENVIKHLRVKGHFLVEYVSQYPLFFKQIAQGLLR